MCVPTRTRVRVCMYTLIISYIESYILWMSEFYESFHSFVTREIGLVSNVFSCFVSQQFHAGGTAWGHSSEEMTVLAL